MPLLPEVTTLQDHEIDSVARILSEWNPLGKDSVKVKDLNWYSTEATDIVCELKMSEGKQTVGTIVQEVLNEAFDLSLRRQECAPYAQRIVECLRTKVGRAD